MNYRKTGQFYGDTNQKLSMEGITLTDTVYTLPKVDWHYHENAYFTFILQGGLIEGNKKEVYTCASGSLLFHHWQDPHYNCKPDVFTRGFHIELNKHFSDNIFSGLTIPEGSLHIDNPEIKLLFYQLFKETKIIDSNTPLVIQTLLLQVFAEMQQNRKAATEQRPVWVNRIKELLYYNGLENQSLQELANALQIHPVHLSRQFPKYFGCTLGNYMRKIKVEKALQLFSDKTLSLTDIAMDCGFADQSHFLRCFKEFNGMTPSQYRTLLS
ncbi:helix-turn-helix transcriptional regulator [Cytophagaceae bacterium DM2B3-1]|uniref:Helix-turn-helix transcriptional regulator n=1 Tax=Xanthocytophaga flava TaxID=3048013 RepID=A0ABT7CNP2_9BACT|nr:helix-turn-helix transcriptional regulator [Xanthocytophaga flavus]MDJ1494304.1 helix-turn-helix transcriptional regulator [Xanthocytophaga flavus]